MEKRDLSKAETHIKALEDAIDHIAFIRRIAEASDVDMEEFDRQLNALCDKCGSKYANMNDKQLAIHGIMEIIELGGNDTIMEMFADKESE